MPLPIAVVLAVVLAACTTPASRVDGLAVGHGYTRLGLHGQGFDHVAYFKPGKPGPVLHVYVEHDGTPWSTPTTPSADPTPTRPIALELMAQDDAPALYLGRPCYFGLARVPPCEQIWWTHRRYSRRVVDSMDAALREFLAGHREYESLQFFGYSGGGVIATLMAADFPQTTRLVTVAAPLDVDSWTARHGYARLEGSLSPLDATVLPRTVAQLHLAGGADEVVPLSLIQPFVALQYTAQRSGPSLIHALLLLGNRLEGHPHETVAGWAPHCNPLSCGTAVQPRKRFRRVARRLYSSLLGGTSSAPSSSLPNFAFTKRGGVP